MKREWSLVESQPDPQNETLEVVVLRLVETQESPVQIWEVSQPRSRGFDPHQAHKIFFNVLVAQMIEHSAFGTMM